MPRPWAGRSPAAAPAPLWSPWGRFGGPRGRLGAPIRPHDALQEDSGSPTALRKDTNDSLLFTDLRFFTTSVAFRTLWRSGMSRFAIKINVFFNNFENAFLVSVSVFYNPRGSEGPSETPFGERSGDFGVPRAPSEIGERLPWAPWASPRAPSRLPLSGPGRKQMGPSQHRKSQFHTVKTILSAMPSFDNPPFN